MKQQMMRIGKVANDKGVRFHNVLNHYTVENLREAFHALDANKACGIDSKTKKQYARNL